MTQSPAKELVVLTADKNCQFALCGLLTRFKALGIRQVMPDYRIHPQKDPGIIRGAHDFLRSFTKTHVHALVIMDREGSGRESLDRVEMEERLQTELSKAGWGERAAAVVIDPELEVWVWSDSPHVATELGWSQRVPDLWTWLRHKALLAERSFKPERPKEALEAALREVRKPRSSALYRALAEKVGLSKCTDPAFTKLKAVLHGWFMET
jgi:hypothetical protein